MAQDYKLCPKCNNPLDFKEVVCPYCWESMWIVIWWNQIKQDKPTVGKTSSVWVIKRLIYIFIVFPIILSIISSLAELFLGNFE